jgi:hypothetical protein
VLRRGSPFGRDFRSLPGHMGDDNIWTNTWDEGEDWSGGARAKRLPRGNELGATV